MNERIQQLVDQLKQMSKPLNLKEVQLHTDELLSRLSEEDETFRDLTKHCQKIHSLVVNLRILEKKQEEIQRSLHTLTQAKQGLDYELLQACLKEQNKDIPPLSSLFSEALLIRLRQQLQQSFVYLQQQKLKLMQFELQQSLQRVQKLKGDMAEFNFNIGLIPMSIEQRQQSVEDSLKRTLNAHALLGEVLRLLESFVQFQTLQSQKQLLEIRIGGIHHKRIELSNDIELNRISDDVKQQKEWTSQYLQIKNKAEVYESLKADQSLGKLISQGINGLDFLTGGCLSLSHYYSEQIVIQKKRRFFLTLFEIEQLKQSEIEQRIDLNDVCEELRQITIPSELSLRQKLNDLAQILDIEEDLFQDFKKLLSFLKTRQPWLEKTAQEYITIRNILQELVSEQHRIKQIRTEYGLYENDEVYLAMKSEIAPDTFDEEDKQLTLKLQKHQESLRQLEALLTAIKMNSDNAYVSLEEVTALIGALEKEIFERFASLQVPEVLKQPSCPVVELNTDVTLPTEVSSIAVPVEKSPEKSTTLTSLPNKTDQKKPTQQTPAPDPVLIGWQQEIGTLAQSGPEDLKIWLNTLIPWMQQQTMTPALWFQCLQLLRDVRMELQHYIATGDAFVLREYYRLCQDDGKDLLPLLAIKPPVPLVEQQPLPDLQHQDLQELIEQLQDLSKTREEPHEANLIEQAAHTLHYIVLQLERNPNFKIPENLNRYAEDPRYEFLKQHQGISAIWQKLIEAWCKLLDLIQPAKQHLSRHSFFYIPTQKEQLFNEAIMATQLIAVGNMT